MESSKKIRWVTEHFDTWQEFREYLEDDLSPAYTLFRGQQDSEWGLCTSLDRLLKTLPVKFRNEKVVDIHLNRFKKAARGRRLGADNRQLEKDEWWALGQHYGLATPLLDWTESAYIAAYFAFSNPTKSGSGKRAIWTFVPNAINNANDKISESYSAGDHQSDEQYLEKSRPPTVEIVEPATDDNPRLINQAGVFTRAPIGISLEDWVVINNENFSIPLLKRLTLPDDERYDVLRALQKMNIHSQSMFPDLVGASNFCNEMLSLQAEVVTVHEEAMRLVKLLEESDANKAN